MPVTFQVVGNLADFGDDPRAGVKVRATATPGVKVGDVAVHSNQPETVVTDEDGAFALTLISVPGVWYTIRTPYSNAINPVNLAGYTPGSEDPTTGTAFAPGVVINLIDVMDEDPTPGYEGIAYAGGGEGGGVTDHGALTGRGDDDHTQYALADGSRGSFATVAQGAKADTAVQPADLSAYATDAELTAGLETKAASSHTHVIADTTGLQAVLDSKADDLGADDNYVTDAEKVKLSNLSGVNTGDQELPTWSTIAGKPAVVAEGATAADARTAIGLGTAATTASTDYATAAQGALADSASQPGHTHAAADVTSGTFAVARLGTGTPAASTYVDGGTGAWTALPSSGGGGCQVDVYAATGAAGSQSSYTWTMPAGAKSVEVFCQSAGGGGGSGRRGATGTARAGGGGGAAGSWMLITLDPSNIPASATLYVGKGGAGGAAVTANDANGNAGGAGGASIFDGMAYSGTGSLIAGGGGGGGTAATGSAGAAPIISPGPGYGTISGLVGAAGSVSAGAASTTDNIGNHAMGGSSGGGITVGNATSAGGIGSKVNALAPDSARPAAGTAGGGNGGNGGRLLPSIWGTAGAGGGSSTTTAGGNGGSGGNYGCGGGGGGASQNGFDSGAGGAGGDGIVIVTTYF